MLASTSPQAALTRLKEAGSAIRADHEAYLARLHEQGARLDAQGQGRAMTRHAEMEERYGQAVSRYLAALDALATEQPTLAQVRELRAILAEILPERPYRIHGSLPYRHLNLPSRKPVTTPAVVPAYRGGTADFAGADLTASPEAPISPAIAGLARSLDWSPVAMYEWVKNNVKTEWYWGAMKGAEETLRQKSGNDADQATLLVALLRAAGFPARYVHGVAEFPDIEAAKAQTGLDDPQAIARLLQKAGIPCETVISGGRISNLRFEHLWVETLVPYANYRGAVLDEQGRTWLALDPSIKTRGYSENSPVPALAGLNLAGVRSDYLAAMRSETPLTFLRSRINEQLALTSPGTGYPDLLRRRTINREEMQILPAGLQFTAAAITGEYAALPDTLLHRVRFTATTSDQRPVFDQTLPVHQLASRSLAVTFEPETIEDQEIMNSYGGLDLTPLYLIRLRPVLTVNGKREIVGTLGLTAGADFTLTTELIAPATSQRVDNTLVAGYPTVIGLAAQQAPGLTAVPLAGMNAERLLFEQAVSYLHQGNQAEEELASLLQLTLARPLPTLVTVGGVLDVVALLDTPHGFAWQGLYLDADLRAVELLGGLAPSGSDPALLFMELAGLHHSVLEHQVFAEGFGVDAVSTAKMLGLANASGLPIQLLHGGNIGTVLPGLNLPPSIAADIAAGVHQGYAVTIPATELSYEDWAGYAYLVESGLDFGWMLAGGIAGGMTALSPERWPPEYRDILTNPDSDFSDNPLAAVELRVIRGPGLLSGTAGAQLPSPLLVVALDREGRLVKGVTVTFTVRAGGGRVRALAADGWTSSAAVTTGQDGRARVELLCPESTTSGNPTTARNPEDMTVQQVDETVIEVTSDTGLQTDVPITVATFPGPAHHLRVTGDGGSGPILTWGATLVAFVEDQFNNPINKVPVHFSMGAAQPRSACASETGDQPGLLIPVDAPCMQHIPVYGECGSQTLDTETALHTGAVAQVLFGGRPDALYPVTISAGGLEKTVTVATHPTGPCDPADEPYRGLSLRLIHTVDNLGNFIDGGPVSKEGTNTIPLLARLFYVREGEEVQSKEYYCAPGTDTCPFVTGNGVYAIDTNFVNARVSFDGTQASPLGNGLFRVDYPLAATPQKKQFQVTGEATLKVRITAQVCDKDLPCTLIEEDLPSPQITDGGIVYSVDITLPKEKYIIPVNEQGQVTYDTEIPFTIAPPEYAAATSYFVLKKQINNTFENIAFFNAKPGGQDKMTLLRGFGLDLESAYQAQVVLNEGSQVMEVKSREMTLQPLALELDADLNRDGQFSEDDPAEYLAPGLVVPLNRDDDDKDGVPDLIDGYNADGVAGNADDTMAEADDDLIEVKVTGLPATLAEGTVTLEILQGAEKIKVWTDRAKAAGSLLLDGPTDPFAAAKTWVLGTDINTLADLPTSLYIEGVDPSADENDGAILVCKYQTAADPAKIETDRLRVTVLPS
ncbi:MAG: transglutaminase domain-containing protein, partial [Thermodesulfobacteriota bacterium]